MNLTSLGSHHSQQKARRRCQNGMPECCHSMHELQLLGSQGHRDNHLINILKNVIHSQMSLSGYYPLLKDSGCSSTAAHKDPIVL